MELVEKCREDGITFDSTPEATLSIRGGPGSLA